MHKARTAIAKALVVATALAAFAPSMVKAANESPNAQNTNVSATVDLSFTFSIDDKDVVLGTLSSTATKYAGPAAQAASELKANTLSVSTNSTNGFSISLGGTTLTSAATDTITAWTPGAASTTGTEQFGVAFDNATGVTIEGNYQQDSSKYGFVPAGATVLSSSNPGSFTADAYYAANIASTTEAGVYNAALVYSATSSM